MMRVDRIGCVREYSIVCIISSVQYSGLYTCVSYYCVCLYCYIYKISYLVDFLKLHC